MDLTKEQVQDSINKAFSKGKYAKKEYCLKAHGRIASINGKEVGFTGNCKSNWLNGKLIIMVEYDYISQEPTGLTFWTSADDISGQYGKEITDYFVEYVMGYTPIGKVI